MYEAKIIQDSICNGHRLTTMQITHPRIVHAEFMTHCMFARNASSSRAIPFSKLKQKVFDDPFFPVWWGKNQAGMQAKEELSPVDIFQAQAIWRDAMGQMISAAEILSDLGLHKQICNRLLEPFGWITVCVTGDSGAWSNYFSLRCHADAQPEIQKQAYTTRDVYFANKPEELTPGEWHLPYVDDSEIFYGEANDGVDIPLAVSTGRCARTSYLTQEGKRDWTKDVELHDRLLNSKPMHASPFEHVCQAMGDDQRYGKYIGWKAYRHFLKDEYITDYKP